MFLASQFDFWRFTWYNSGMNDAKLSVLVATVISSLDETTGETREGILYAGLMGHVSYEEFRALVSVLVKIGAVSRGPNHLLKLTDKGRELAKKLAEQVANIKREKIAAVPN
jgi:hypothetical protein